MAMTKARRPPQPPPAAEEARDLEQRPHGGLAATAAHGAGLKRGAPGARALSARRMAPPSRARARRRGARAAGSGGRPAPGGPRRPRGPVAPAEALVADAPVGLPPHAEDRDPGAHRRRHEALAREDALVPRVLRRRGARRPGSRPLHDARDPARDRAELVRRAERRHLPQAALVDVQAVEEPPVGVLLRPGVQHREQRHLLTRGLEEARHAEGDERALAHPSDQVGALRLHGAERSPRTGRPLLELVERVGPAELPLLREVALEAVDRPPGSR